MTSHPTPATDARTAYVAIRQRFLDQLLSMSADLETAGVPDQMTDWGYVGELGYHLSQLDAITRAVTAHAAAIAKAEGRTL